MLLGPGVFTPVVLYKAVSVFDISQTEGEELASLVRLLEGDHAGLFASLARVGV